MSDVTRILSKIESGDQQASKELLPLVYEELRRLAAVRMNNERVDHTLQATALVHEAYMRLVDADSLKSWDSRGHFFAAAAEAMRRILVDAAIRKNRPKHGGDRKRVDLEAHLEPTTPSDARILALSEALDKLHEVDSEAALVVKLKHFAGLTITEIAELEGLSARTVDRRWAFGRAWLHQELSG